MTDSYEVVVLGAGPAGLGAALNLVRARFRTLVLDANRPRNAATLHSHGYPTRDGISPLELRKLGREEIERYPEAEVQNAKVTRVSRDGDRFVVRAAGVRGTPDRTVSADVVAVCTGLAEEFPALPGLRAFYGATLHSCIACDAYEHADEPVALIGETGDLADSARLLTRWTDDLIVFTNGADALSVEQEAELARRGVRVERRGVRDVVGDRTGMTGVQLEDGEVVLRSAGFVCPVYRPAIDYAAGLALEVDGEGLLLVDVDGRTSVPGVYAAGDSTTAGAQQLIVAAGAGARLAAAVLHDRA